ncbi:MAG: HAD hydrolase family protein [Desulfobacterium sp.]|nr:HAD hydrolase family protein [Desulfobacterium sp.]
MFITDLDGTLLNDDRRISQEDLNALEALGKMGVVRVVATGRSWYSFHKAITSLALGGPDNFLPVDYVIFSTGAGIMAFPSMELVCDHSLSQHEVHRITDHFEAERCDYMVHRPIPRTREFVFRSHGRDNPDFRSRIEIYRPWAKPMDAMGINGFGRATQVVAVVPGQGALGVFKNTQIALPDLSVVRATSPLDHESMWIEVFPGGVSKSHSAAWLVDKLGMGQNNVVAVGNDYNDLDLLLWAGKGFVVTNAPPDIKSRFITVPSNNNSGVARVISY